MAIKKMRVLHTADWHLGRNRKFDDYLQQQQYMMEGILFQLETALLHMEEDDKVWFVLAGDVFDRNEDTLLNEFSLFIRVFFTKLLQLKKIYGTRFDFDIIDGNHDRKPKVDEPSVLSCLTEISENVQVVNEKYFPDRRVLLLPFRNLTEQQIREALEKYPAQFVVAHECLARMRTDTGWSPPRDQDHYVEINNVLNHRVVGVFLGDIHKCQHLDEEQRCWYSGSPVTLDHGHRLPKGVLHHFYRLSSDGNWEIDKEPKLIAIDDPRIRTHFQLGILSDPNDLPRKYLDLVAAGRAYIQMTITPEVETKLGYEYPDLLTSTYVAYNTVSDPESLKATEVDVPEANDELVAKLKSEILLIDKWFEEYSKALSKDARQKCKEAIYHDFGQRS